MKNSYLKYLETYPTFLVIGAQKCGTNWLAQMVSQHPEVCVPSKKTYIFFDKIHKELEFFNKRQRYAYGLEWYKSWFKIKPYTKAAGEFTPNYLWTSERNSKDGKYWNTPALVHKHFPNLKLIVSFRDPVERAISAYYHHIRKGRFDSSQRILSVAEKYGIVSMGYYDVDLRRWMRYFSPDNFLILIFEEDLKDENKRATLKKIFQHINVSDLFVPRNIFSKFYARNTHLEMRLVRYPIPGIIRKIFSSVMPKYIKHHRLWHIQISDQEKAVLRTLFNSHNRNLEKMIERKLPW